MNMSENFFTDNLDIQFRLEQLDLSDVLELKENGYTYAQEYPAAPRNYADAEDNYRLMLEVLGDICANVVAPRAAEADEEGAQFRDGEVYYSEATQAALDALNQAELMGAMLPWEYGGLNLPNTVLQMVVVVFGICIVSRCGRVLSMSSVSLFHHINDFPEVQFVQSELQIKVVGEEIVCHSDSPYLAFSR